MKKYSIVLRKAQPSDVGARDWYDEFWHGTNLHISSFFANVLEIEMDEGLLAYSDFFKDSMNADCNKLFNRITNSFLKQRYFANEFKDLLD